MSTTSNIIPHQAVLMVRGEIMENLPNGQVNPMSLEEVSAVFTVKGDSLEHCSLRTKAFLEAINRIPPQQVEEIMKELS